MPITLYCCQRPERDQPSRCSWQRVVGFQRSRIMWLWSLSKRMRWSATCWMLLASHQHGGTTHCNPSSPSGCALPVYHKHPVNPLTCSSANFLQLAPPVSSVKSPLTQPKIPLTATSKPQSYVLNLSLVPWPSPPSLLDSSVGFMNVLFRNCATSREWDFHISVTSCYIWILAGCHDAAAGY